MSAKRVCQYVDPAYHDKDTHILDLKTQAMYGTESS